MARKRRLIETGLASTMAEGRKQAREVYNPAPELARRRLRVRTGGGGA